MSLSSRLLEAAFGLMGGLDWLVWKTLVSVFSFLEPELLLWGTDPMLWLELSFLADDLGVAIFFELELLGAYLFFKRLVSSDPVSPVSEAMESLIESESSLVGFLGLGALGALSGGALNLIVPFLACAGLGSLF
jgi:hypothetical protein